MRALSRKRRGCGLPRPPTQFTGKRPAIYFCEVAWHVQQLHVQAYSTVLGRTLAIAARYKGLRADRKLACFVQKTYVAHFRLSQVVTTVQTYSMYLPQLFLDTYPKGAMHRPVGTPARVQLGAGAIKTRTSVLRESIANRLH